MDRIELYDIRRFTRRSELDKALHSLQGILQGIAIDGVVSSREANELRQWAGTHYEHIDRHPFKELIPLLDKALADGRIDPEESQDILWLAHNLTTGNRYYDVLTSDMQKLHGIVHSILADGLVTDQEIQGLSKWLFENEQLRGTYPFDELCSLITAIKSDGRIDETERNTLKVFMADFVAVQDMPAIDQAELQSLKQSITIRGICALDPQIVFRERLFCLTGLFAHGERSEIARTIQTKGALCKENLTKDTDYLAVGSQGNPCWAFSCYGRKVEKAVQMRKEGSSIAIVNEVDLWDAMH